MTGNFLSFGGNSSAFIEESEAEMPVKIKRVNGYRVSHGGKVSAKETTKENAEAQARLLRGIEHGWEPTQQPAREKLRARRKSRR